MSPHRQSDVTAEDAIPTPSVHTHTVATQYWLLKSLIKSRIITFLLFSWVCDNF